MKDGEFLTIIAISDHLRELYLRLQLVPDKLRFGIWLRLNNIKGSLSNVQTSYWCIAASFIRAFFFSAENFKYFNYCD